MTMPPKSVSQAQPQAGGRNELQPYSDGPCSFSHAFLHSPLWSRTHPSSRGRSSCLSQGYCAPMSTMQPVTLQGASRPGVMRE